MSEENRVGQPNPMVVRKILWIGGFLPCQSVLEELERVYTCQVHVVNHSDISVCGIIELLSDDQYVGIATMGNNSNMQLPFIITGGKPQHPESTAAPVPDDSKVIVILPHYGKLLNLGIPNDVVERQNGVRYISIRR